MAASPAIPSPDLILETEKSPSETIVRCSGRITSATNPQFHSTVRGLIPETKRIVLDLTNVSHVDSSGLGALVGAYISARRAQCELKLLNLGPRVKELFRISKIAKICEGQEDMLGAAPD